MRKTIKKANSKWILLFLFMFLSVGVKAQQPELGGYSGSWLEAVYNNGGWLGEVVVYNNYVAPKPQPYVYVTPTYTPYVWTNTTYSGGGGGGSSSFTPRPPTIDPCTEIGIAAANKVNATLSSAGVVNSLQNLNIYSLTENGFLIYSSSNGNISGVTQEEGTTNGLNLTGYTINTIADVHTHPYTGSNAPSAQDLYALYDKSTKIKDFQTSYIAGYFGYYALHIDDSAKFDNFVKQNPNFVNKDTNNFKAGTIVGDSWLATYDSLVRQGFGVQESYTRATVIILQDSGVSLLKSGSGDPIDFKKLDNIVPGYVSKGNIIIINNDCK